MPVTELSAGGVKVIPLQVGASFTAGETEQVNDTTSLKPESEFTVIVEVADWPGATVDGVGADTVKEKSGIG